jgi:hypothetical protein
VDDVLTAALPHELCHLVLADRFRDAPPPLWFDEGVALLYDPAEKRALHERDLQIGRRRGTAFPLSELVSQRTYPSPDRWGVFYGQSGALARRLVEMGSPEQLLQFAERSRKIGVEVSLRQIYQLPGVDALDRAWARHMTPLNVELPEALALPPSTPLLAATARP